MQLIVNRADLVEPLARKILHKILYKKYAIQFPTTDAYVNKISKQLKKTGLLNANFADINNFIYQDLAQSYFAARVECKKTYRRLVKWLEDQSFCINNDILLEFYKNSTDNNLLTAVAEQITDDIEYITVQQDNNPGFALIRNILHNEQALLNRISNNIEFWFIDNGYTNFLRTDKLWNRLVKDRLHHNLQNLNFPGDRLQLFDTFPMPWQSTGQKILVIENSEYHYRMFGTTAEEWKNNVAQQLSESSDLPVEYRPKDLDRKTRSTVYDLLRSSPGEYYCVISDCSAAAVEAVWAGVPIITLQPHISVPVARTSISDINNLYRGPIGDWLCALSYSQFTNQELKNGTALSIMEKYYA